MVFFYYFRAECKYLSKIFVTSLLQKTNYYVFIIECEKYKLNYAVLKNMKNSLYSVPGH